MTQMEKQPDKNVLLFIFLFQKKMDENIEAALRQIIQVDPDSGKHLGSIFIKNKLVLNNFSNVLY